MDFIEIRKLFRHKTKELSKELERMGPTKVLIDEIDNLLEELKQKFDLMKKNVPNDLYRSSNYMAIFAENFKMKSKLFRLRTCILQQLERNE